MITAEMLAAQLSRLARRVVDGDLSAAVAMGRLTAAIDDYISGAH